MRAQFPPGRFWYLLGLLIIPPSLPLVYVALPTKGRACCKCGTDGPTICVAVGAEPSGCLWRKLFASVAVWAVGGRWGSDDPPVDARKQM